VIRDPKKRNVPVDQLEQQLQLSLRRVEPDRQFVNHLQSRLNGPTITVMEQRQNSALVMLLAALSMLSGVLLFWLVHQIRAAGHTASAADSIR
jgi:hypothetical protein